LIANLLAQGRIAVKQLILSPPFCLRTCWTEEESCQSADLLTHNFDNKLAGTREDSCKTAGIRVRFGRGSLKNGYHIQGRQQARKLPNERSCVSTPPFCLTCWKQKESRKSADLGTNNIDSELASMRKESCQSAELFTNNFDSELTSMRKGSSQSVDMVPAILFVNLLERDYKERYYTGTLGYNPECINTI
jgi:hypothetical protein